MTRTHSLIRTVDDLKARCKVDPNTLCWEWQGGMSAGRQPRIHAFDHEIGDKRVMTGQRAAWNIAHGKAPLPGWLVYRACGNSMCLCPAHLREMPSKAAIGEAQRRSGRFVGQHLEQRQASMRLAHAAAGVVATPREVVSAIRSASAAVTGRALAAQFGMRESTVSRIRRGESHKGVAAC